MADLTPATETPAVIPQTQGSPPRTLSKADAISIAWTAAYIGVGWLLSDILVRFVPTIKDHDMQVFVMGGCAFALKVVKQWWTDNRPDQATGLSQWAKGVIVALVASAATAVAVPSLPPEPIKGNPPPVLVEKPADPVTLPPPDPAPKPASDEKLDEILKLLKTPKVFQ